MYTFLGMFTFKKPVKLKPFRTIVRELQPEQLHHWPQYIPLSTARLQLWRRAGRK
jgi:hypothetical protein